MSRHAMEEQKIDAALVRLIVEFSKKEPCHHDSPMVTMYGMEVCLECLRLAAA
jgi:hypothetical protein